jgi:hypothetical protein
MQLCEELHPPLPAVPFIHLSKTATAISLPTYFKTLSNAALIKPDHTV